MTEETTAVISRDEEKIEKKQTADDENAETKQAPKEEEDETEQFCSPPSSPPSPTTEAPAAEEEDVPAVDLEDARDYNGMNDGAAEQCIKEEDENEQFRSPPSSLPLPINEAPAAEKVPAVDPEDVENCQGAHAEAAEERKTRLPEHGDNEVVEEQYAKLTEDDIDRPVFGPERPPNMYPASKGSGNETETAGYEPPSPPSSPPSMPRSGSSDTIADEEGERMDWVLETASEDNGGDKEKEQLIYGEALVDTFVRRTRGYDINTGLPVKPRKSVFGQSKPEPNKIRYAMAMDWWKPRIGTLYKTEINTKDANNGLSVTCFLGGSGKTFKMLVYDGTPCTLIQGDWYKKHVIGETIPWVFGTELKFLNVRWTQSTGHCRADYGSTIPISPVRLMTHNPYRFLTGENFYRYFKVRGIGMLPFVIGQTPFLIQGLIVDNILPIHKATGFLKEELHPVHLGPEFRENFERFLTVDSSGNRLLMPVAPPGLTLQAFPDSGQHHHQLQVGIACERSPAPGEKGGVGIFFANMSMFNVAVPLNPDVTAHHHEYTQVLYAHIFGVKAIEDLLYHHGIRPAINTVAVYTSDEALIRGLENETSIRQFFSVFEGESKEALEHGWDILINAVARLRDNNLLVNFFPVVARAESGVINGKGAGLLAKIAQRCDDRFYPACSGSGKQISVDDLVLRCGLDGVKRLCEPLTGKGEEEKEKEKEKDGLYVITESDYIRCGILKGFATFYLVPQEEVWDEQEGPYF